MTREEHKDRIVRKRRVYEAAKLTMEKVWGIRDRLEQGSVFSKGMEDLDSELRFNIIKTDLETYLQEAIEAGYPELTI